MRQSGVCRSLPQALAAQAPAFRTQTWMICSMGASISACGRRATRRSGVELEGDIGRCMGCSRGPVGAGWVQGQKV